MLRYLPRPYAIHARKIVTKPARSRNERTRMTEERQRGRVLRATAPKIKLLPCRPEVIDLQVDQSVAVVDGHLHLDQGFDADQTGDLG